MNIRIFNLKLSGGDLLFANMDRALMQFYGEEMPPAQGGEDFKAYEQWVSLETPGGLLQGENPDDQAYAFHRSLGALNHFLMALEVATGDRRIRRLDSHDLRPAMFIGAYAQDKKWHPISSMMMHPDAIPEWFTTDPNATVDMTRVNAAFAAMANAQPYLAARRWRVRAQRAIRYDGDPADSVISFQIAAESLLYETWRMLLVDEGLLEADIEAEMSKDIPFKSLLTKLLPQKLGGNWDVTRASSPISQYWNDLYLVRNKIIHAAYEPHGGDAEKAEGAYQGLRDFLHDRLHANYKTFPRTFFVRLGTEGIQKLGWMTKWMEQFMADVATEPGEYFWPRDKAGR